MLVVNKTLTAMRLRGVTEELGDVFHCVMALCALKEHIARLQITEKDVHALPHFLGMAMFTAQKVRQVIFRYMHA